MKIKLTLDEKYKELSDFVTTLKSDCTLSEVLIYTRYDAPVKNAKRRLNISRAKMEELIAKIYVADEIEWIEPKYNWRLKSEKFVHRYISKPANFRIRFYGNPYGDDVMTESELKKLLEGTGLPFEAFEKVNADE